MKNFYNIEFLNNVISDRKNRLTTSEIMEKYSLSPNTLAKILKDNGMDTHFKDASTIKRFLKVEEVIKEEDERGQNVSKYKVRCACGCVGLIQNFTARKLYDIKKKYQCDKCSVSLEVRHNRASRYKKRIDNTTGYIGVFIKKDYRY